MVRSLIMLSNIVKAFDHIQSEILAQIILPVINPVWPVVC